MANLNGTFEDASGNLILNTPHSYAYIETGTTATKAYAKGDLMVFKNQLCQATTAISTGTTLSLNSNVVSTSVANQLSNIKVYVGNDNKLHFVDHAGADSVLPFSSGKDTITFFFVANYAGSVMYYKDSSSNRNTSVSELPAGSTWVVPEGSYWPKIWIERKTENGTWTFTITIRNNGYYWIPNSANSGRGSWQYKNKDDVITLAGGIKTGTNILIQYHADLTEDT